MVKKINKEKEELKKQIAELENNWKRTLADYRNLEKRTIEERRQWSKFASKNILCKLLPVLDTLEKAAEHLKDGGLNLAVKQFKDILINEGITEIEALGKTFDPTIHESVDIEEGEDENKIVKVYEKGYKLNGQVIRPAKVKVVKKKIDQKEEELAKKAAQTGNYM